jgi:hypothetical protein
MRVSMEWKCDCGDLLEAEGGRSRLECPTCGRTWMISERMFVQEGKLRVQRDVTRWESRPEPEGPRAAGG